MVSVIKCIVYEHNSLLVILAIFICVFGTLVTLRLVKRAVNTIGMQRLGWQFLAAVAGGGSVWTTHFVAMLAYKSTAPVTFDPILTITSLVIAILGLLISFSISSAYPAVGGAFVGLSFTAMHYAGMFAYRVVGLVSWKFDYMLASALIPVATTSVALSIVHKEKIENDRFGTAALLIVFGIIALHFTGMTAFQITPMRHNFPEIDRQAVIALAFAIAVVALIIVGTGLTSFLIDHNVRSISQRELHYLATHDALTDLPNLISFRKQLKLSEEHQKHKNTKFAVVGIDLNRFKELNDTFGHAAGDEALQTIARRMTLILTDSEFVARIGGDEFAAVICFCRKSEISEFVDRIATVFDRPISIDNIEIRIGASFGAAIWPDHATTLDELVNNADLAMYQAKHSYSKNVRFYDADIGEGVRNRRQLAEDLSQALEKNQLELHYQVQKSLVDASKILGYEALLRWKHPEHGAISPAKFIPIAEENGLIVQLGAWVLNKACCDAANWPSDQRVAVNVSAMQFADARLPHIVKSALIESGLSPQRLELELTETALSRDKVHSLQIMEIIRKLGVGIALDDFGIGYSSLETLRLYPIDKIKIDKSFVEDVESDRQSIAIVRAVLALGKSLKIPVLAEGIESYAQLNLLRQEGCNEGQGYLLGRPTRLQELQKHNPIVSNVFVPQIKLSQPRPGTC